MCFCPEMWEKLSFVFCFCSLGLKTFLSEKSVLFSTVLEITFKILFSLQEKQQKNSAQKKNLHFFVFAFSLNIFFHHFFLCSLLTSPFSLLSFLHSFLISPSHVSSTSFLHRRFCVSSFCFTSLFFSFVHDLIFLFILLLYLFFVHHLRIFCTKKFKNLWSNFST